MTTQQVPDDPVGAIALLDEPNRRRLYDYVAASHQPVGRDDAATALGLTRELVAFHLDRLVGVGLLDTEYRRRGGRTGPGAGRPAKLYRRAKREIAVSLPARHYERAADLMASALDRLADPSTTETLRGVAREAGALAGGAARRSAGARPGRRRRLAALVDLLRGAGFEPEVDRTSHAICLRNCPYESLASGHRQQTCGMNLAWAGGLLQGLQVPGVSVELAPEPGRCCVVFDVGGD